MSRIVLAASLVFGLVYRAAAQDAAPADDTEAIVAAEGGADEKGEAAAQQPAEPAHEPTPEAKSANEAFEALVTQWNGLVEQLKALQKDRDAAQGESRAEFEQQMAEVRKQTTDLIGKISEAGVAVFKADPIAYPRVNATLLSISQYHMIGDPHGDGGDQYERALVLAKGLLDAGAGDKWPQLYMTGGIAAYCVGELDVAEEYLTKAKEAGLFAGLPERTGRETPAVKLALDARDYLENLPTHRKHWEAEQAIRAEEAKADDLPRVKLTTTKGDVVIELFENEAPESVANFITLVKKGYYDGVTFHRVLPLFMAQGGDPDGTGMGGPGYTIRDEQRAPKARLHFRGSLSMANTGQPNSGGSQFFLTFVPTTFLDGRHAVFGRVIEGMDVAASLKRRDPDGPGPKATPDRILKAEVLRDRGHEYKFEQVPE
jgi:cyclophilin family peptidyl-prolyl cis-trans isomerase